MMRIKDVNPDAVRLRLFPFSLRGKAKDWLLSLLKGTIIHGMHALVLHV
jgi:hypothetical protein